MENGPFEDVFPIKYGDNSIAMLVYQRLTPGIKLISWPFSLHLSCFFCFFFETVVFDKKSGSSSEGCSVCPIPIASLLRDLTLNFPVTLQALQWCAQSLGDVH